MAARLEHANIAVRNIDATLAFITTALPEFDVRRSGVNSAGRRWVHVGTDEAYIALNEATYEPNEKWVPYGGAPGVNHIGLEVDDAVALRARMHAAGYRDSTVPNNHPFRRRVYFYDPDGNDWEFVEYLSDIAAERNDYELTD